MLHLLATMTLENREKHCYLRVPLEEVEEWGERERERVRVCVCMYYVV